MNLYDLAKEMGVSREDAIKAFDMLSEDCYATEPTMPLTKARIEQLRSILKQFEKVTPTPVPPIAPGVARPPIRKTHRLEERDFIVLTQSVIRKPQLARFLEKFLEAKSRSKNHSVIVILRGCYDDLRVAIEDDDALAENLEYLEVLEKDEFVVVLTGDPANEDNVIFRYITAPDKEKRSILVIGRNVILSQKIERYNETHKGNGYIPIYERDLDRNGELCNPNKYNPAFTPAKDGLPLAPYSTRPRTLNGEIPMDVGSIVNLSDGIQGRLGACISEGGAEGKIFRFGEIGGIPKCVKILKPNHSTEMKFKKLELMIRNYQKLRDHNPYILDRIAWPEEFVYNDCNEPVGYIMRDFRKLRPFSEFNHDSFPRLIPGLTKKHQIAMGKSFAEIVTFMHEHNVILCDINKKNLMFDENQQAYLVDLDSAQIADKGFYYSASVGIPEYHSPEHIGKEDYSFLHKPADDVWIMQMLLFSMLTPMADPYATTKSDDEVEIVRNGYYPYQAGDHPAESLAEERNGMWHIAISHLPAYLKLHFWESFHGNGKHFAEENRMAASEWLRDMIRYEQALPGMVNFDPNSGKYRPTVRKAYKDKAVNNAPQKRKNNFYDLLAKAKGLKNSSSDSGDDNGQPAQKNSRLVDNSRDWNSIS